MSDMRKKGCFLADPLLRKTFFSKRFLVKFSTKRKYFYYLKQSLSFCNYFNSSIIVALNKINHKMQFDKLYNLQTEVYFNCILFVLKTSKTLRGQFLLLWKDHFFRRTRISFSYFIFLSPDIFSLKKAKYTTRYSVKKSTIYKIKFIVFLYFLCSKQMQILCIRFLQGQKLVSQSFACFQNKKYTVKINFTL